MSIKFLVLGGGGILGWGGGGKADFIFMGTRIFLKPSASLGNGRGTVGKCTGPKWSRMVQTTILVKMTLFRTGF